MNAPIGVTVDTAGNVYIADTLNIAICGVGTDGKISTIAGNGTSNFSGDGSASTGTT